ncbi:RNA polymerase sigma factor SigX [Planctomycetes bacterium K2D]|uniref:RNA polymerase sigma factor SigX n=2 Tax=Botrimarina mediterranea TaxID=2528022 RepID=A0A518K7V5_9BACT|nr:RNA polymerase sigma factor SigX [Botrimarina mediterranea]QDV78496.1 RNA polymerase sigma factor SigX [Planctomycetes bacterium K2D]
MRTVAKPHQAMDKSEEYQEVVEQLVGMQLALHRYLLTILGDSDAASTVLQEANIVLLKKWADYTPGTNFVAWARSVAYMQALAYVRDRRRERLVFSEEVVRQLEQRAELNDDTSEDRLALRHCLAQLSKGSLELVQLRYRDGSTIDEMAGKMGKSSSSIKVALHRIRRGLLTCVQRQLADVRN